jgi:SCY1-like protein 1
VIVSKLSDRTINGELLKHLAKASNDEQPGIRTNTTIVLGKLAKSLGNSTRSKVLIAAFTRSLRDPFVHARSASLMALAVTGEYFSEEDTATRIMPCICPLLIDKEKLVRDQASKTLEVYMQKVKKAAANMPETVLSPQTTADSSGGVAPRMSTPQPSESSAATWTGWAISSFTNKLSAAAGEMQTAANGSGTSSPQAVTSPGPEPKKTSMTSSASALHRQAVKSPPPSMSRTSSAGAAAAAEAFWQDDDPVGDGGAWGDMDEDSFFDAPSESTTTASGTTAQPARKEPATASATPFGDDAEPDFAGWLAAQEKKKKGGPLGSKPLPKGLGKPSATTTAAKKPVAVAKSAAKPVAAKKIDLKPKAADDDDGWGDGW